jgi:gas vesicle protein
MFNLNKGEKMNEPTLKQKKQLLEELKNLFNQFEEVEHRTCFRNYFSNNFVDKYYAMSNDIDWEISYLEEEIQEESKIIKSTDKPIETKDIKVDVNRLQKLGIIKEGA